MLVFVSWSGPRSKFVAEALETWLSQVIQTVEPYYSNKHKSNQPDFPYLLFIDDLRKTIGHVINKSIGLVPPQQLRNIATYYHIAENAIYTHPKGVLSWKRTIEVYFELVKLAAGLGEFEKMLEFI